jgi:hypothetical protein
VRLAKIARQARSRVSASRSMMAKCDGEISTANYASSGTPKYSW